MIFRERICLAGASLKIVIFACFLNSCLILDYAAPFRMQIDARLLPVFELPSGHDEHKSAASFHFDENFTLLKWWWYCRLGLQWFSFFILFLYANRECGDVIWVFFCCAALNYTFRHLFSKSLLCSSFLLTLVACMHGGWHIEVLFSFFAIFIHSIGFSVVYETA